MYGSFPRRKMFFLLALLPALLAAAPLAIDSRTTVVVPDAPGAIEKQAADILCRHLGQIFQTQVACVGESAWNGSGTAIFCGRKFARPGAKPDRDDFALFRDGSRVILTGGECGVLYSVYEFLERVCDVRYLGPYDAAVPRQKSIPITDGFEHSGRPYFRYRLMTNYIRNRDYAEYLSWHRIQDMDDCGALPAELGGNLIGSPRFCHTFARYANRFPEKKPEYFSLVDGRRLITNGDRDAGQLCLSNPELRAVMRKTLRTFIEEDRAAARKKGVPYPLIYAVEQNDNRHFCACGECLKRIAELGNQSDLLLDMINELAADISQDYPEIKLMTFAYRQTREPPKTVKPRDNVLIMIALLGGEFDNSIKDTMRSIEHPLNAEAKALYLRWRQAGFRLATWEYGIVYRRKFQLPCLLGGRGLQENVRFFARNGVELIFQEGSALGGGMARYIPFFDLHNYLLMKLMSDPELDVDMVVDDFMHHAYGPAAKPMRQLYDLLENAMDKEKRSFGSCRVPSYLDREFFVAAEKLLLEAELLTADDRDCRRRVLKEYAGLGFGMLLCWDDVFREKPFSLTKEQVAERLVAAHDVCLAQYGKGYTPEVIRRMRKWCREILDLYFLNVRPKGALPEEARGRRIVADFTWMDSGHKFDVGQKSGVVIVDDGSACQGKALRLVRSSLRGAMHGVKPFVMGLYDNATRKTVAERAWDNADLPHDEKYHWFHIPNVKIPEGPQFFAHWTWVLTPASRSQLAGALKPGTVCDIWYSMKFEGPAYCPGSKKENAVFADRLLFVESR